MLTVRSANCLGALAAAVLSSVALAGEHRFRVTADSTSMLDAGLNAPLAGTLIGNWDATANPTGTRTLRGLGGGNPNTDNQTIDYTADLAAQLLADRVPTGGFNVRIPTNGDQAAVNGLGFDLLAGEPLDLTVTLDLVFQTFRTRQPNAFFIGSASFPPIPIANGQVTALRIEQAGDAPAVVTPMPGGGSAFAAMVPVNVVVQVSVLGQPLVDQSLPAMLPVSGTVGMGPGAPGASISFKTGFATALPELPAFSDQPIGVPTYAPPGSTANLLFSGQFDGPSSTLGIDIAVDLALTSAPVPVDITDDGVVDGADLAEVLWAWGTANPACDLDESGTVDGTDLGLVIACWGVVPG